VKGFFHPTKLRCSSNRFIVHFENHEIVKCYSQIAHTLLNYYAPVNNFSNIKGIVSLLKQGCAYTIAHKHNKNKHWVYLEYGRNCTIFDEGQKLIAELPSDNLMSQKPTKYPESHFKKDIGLELDEILRKYSFRFYRPGTVLSECAVEGCTYSDIETHHIQKFCRKKEKEGQVSAFGLKGHRVKGVGPAILIASNKKKILFCRQHHLEFKSGKFTKLDRSFFKEIYKTPLYHNQIFQEFHKKETSDI
jgi:Type II intron maturase